MPGNLNNINKTNKRKLTKQSIIFSIIEKRERETGSQVVILPRKTKVKRFFTKKGQSTTCIYNIGL